jgi:beta-N-acetylhexosaminidase
MKMKFYIKISIIVLVLAVILSGCGASAGDPGEETSGTNRPGSNITDGNGNQQDSTHDLQGSDDGNGENSGSVDPYKGMPDGSEPGDDRPGDGRPGYEDDGNDIEVRIKEMTLDEKIGQMFIIGFEGKTISDELTDMLKTRAPGGVILFSSNVKSPEQLLDLINSIKSTNSGREPLFISVDEEGGRVSRMPESLTDIPSAASIGEYGDISISYEIGSLLAEEISSFGFNMDFAPVLDIFSNPDNKVISDRSYGNTAQAVSEHGIQLMKGIREKGVIPVVKHFPGHGDTVADSHKELPVVEHDMGRLTSSELVPFQRAVDENADAVMVGHLLMKAIDPENPAALSEAVITDLLRIQMGFAGVVMTDDMTMGAITKNYDIGDAVVSSVIAGSDIILVCHGYDNQIQAIDAVRSAVETGDIDEARIDESVARILRLKAKYGLEDRIIESVDIEGLNKKIDAQLVKWYNRD